MALDLVVEENGRSRKKSDIDWVENLIKLKNSKDQWAVIDALLERWLKDTPEEVEALKIEIGDHRELLTDKEFGQTAGGKDFERRFTLVFPRKLMLMIRSMYPPEELEFDPKFYREFVKRYPSFKVAQKN
jgi:hypothetical protein